MSDQYVGEIRMFAGLRPPSGWCVCDGRELSVSQYQVLYTLLGTTYGGDGVSIFKLPDLRGRALVHQGKSSTGTSYGLGAVGGQETVTVLEAQLPSHSHVVLADPAPNEATSATPASSFWGSGPNNAYANVAATAQMGPGLVTATGGGQAHDNMMPYVVVNFIIALEGIFPSQS